MTGGILLFHMGFGLMDSLFPIFFFLIFVIVIAMFIVVIVKGAGQWSRNNRAPLLTVDATVVSRRADVSHHMGGAGDAGMSHSSTSYYVTFQVDSGDRMELRVSGKEYGLLAEGDEGRLTFQGTRYQGFIRSIENV